MTKFYITEEMAFAPGIADGWPTIIKAPHTKNGRLRLMSDEEAERFNNYAALQERLEAAEAALESIAGMVLDGEDDGEGAYEMSTEDAYESIVAAVQCARAALRREK